MDGGSFVSTSKAEPDEVVAVEAGVAFAFVSVVVEGAAVVEGGMDDAEGVVGGVAVVMGAGISGKFAALMFEGVGALTE